MGVSDNLVLAASQHKVAAITRPQRDRHQAPVPFAPATFRDTERPGTAHRPRSIVSYEKYHEGVKRALNEYLLDHEIEEIQGEQRRGKRHNTRQPAHQHAERIQQANQSSKGLSSKSLCHYKRGNRLPKLHRKKAGERASEASNWSDTLEECCERVL
ncbi:MAG: hypothetical protein J3Q66DRAFT_149791 [Benniella sp.]|nr:MAG: hypothetical protein J3Q66DRAFT_149791 [Benniella sp.]